jgi:hypothetical protein
MSGTHPLAASHGNSKAAKQLNELIDTLQFKARSKYNDLLNETDVVSAAMLRDALLGINSGKVKGYYRNLE